jgi:exodeoxyribonuclease V alpha subunit
LYTCADAAQLRNRLDAWLDAHPHVYGALTNASQTAQSALAQLHRAQILCALREGTFGARGINALLEQRLGARFGTDTTRTWYQGRPVLITRNDYARDLFNGDIGVALLGTDGMRVWFEDRAHGGVRSFPPRALPEHETAWAITIHRSQGSEYEDVAVVLPPEAAHRMLSRELLYTAVSRATRSAQIWSTVESVRAAAHTPVVRIGGLRERLR